MSLHTLYWACLSTHSFITYVWMCVCCIHVDVRGQLVGTGSSLPPHGLLRSNSGYQALFWSHVVCIYSRVKSVQHCVVHAVIGYFLFYTWGKMTSDLNS